jgi:hypothetical protein
MPHSQPSPNAGLITATIEAATGKIVEVRSIDDAGASGELTADRRAKLSKQSGEATLEDLVEQAFEAGIACVLGDDAEGDEASESKEDVALRRQILRPMIANSAARRLMRQEVLGRAIVGTLIQKAAARGADAAAPSRPSPTP